MPNKNNIGMVNDTIKVSLGQYQRIMVAESIDDIIFGQSIPNGQFARPDLERRL
jgi:hypothetical protein